MAEEITTCCNQEENLSELLQIRRDKLSQLQESGADPFHITKFTRSHWCDEVRSGFEALEEKDVRVCGRLMSKRGMGKAIFGTFRMVMHAAIMYV
jgi:lysyl-tRNA synthetase class 2